jgi:hypothetical protein
MTAVELAGIKVLIKEWCGLDINLIDAGPSVNDPMGLVRQYISFRDPTHNEALAIKITDAGKMELVSKI